VLGPLRDHEFFRRRAVFCLNIPPTFPFFVGVDPRVVDAAALVVLFDPALVDKRDMLAGPYSPGADFTGGTPQSTLR
jgi:hydroperoxide lyase